MARDSDTKTRNPFSRVLLGDRLQLPLLLAQEVSGDLTALQELLLVLPSQNAARSIDRRSFVSMIAAAELTRSIFSDVARYDLCRLIYILYLYLYLYLYSTHRKTQSEQ